MVMTALKSLSVEVGYYTPTGQITKFKLVDWEAVEGTTLEGDFNIARDIKRDGNDLRFSGITNLDIKVRHTTMPQNVELKSEAPVQNFTDWLPKKEEEDPDRTMAAFLDNQRKQAVGELQRANEALAEMRRERDEYKQVLQGIAAITDKDSLIPPTSRAEEANKVARLVLGYDKPKKELTIQEEIDQEMLHELDAAIKPKET
jgi:hypothetical protein